MNGVRSWLRFMDDEWDDIWVLTVEHARLVLGVMVAAIIFSVALGMVVHRSPLARNIALGVASVFLTIPSLALFTLFIPVFGIGKRPVQVALFMYAILPILRNTVTGLAGVDPAVEESARGMGMTSTRRLLQVKLPQAWPVIITGVRVSTLLITGIAAIATLVNGGGLGDLINRGLTRLGFPNSLERIWAGTVMTIAVALVFDLILVILRRLLTPRVLASAVDVAYQVVPRRRRPSAPDLETP